MNTEEIKVTFDPYVVEIPHTGISFRTALGFANTTTQAHLASGEASLEELDENWRPKFKIKYKGTIIGTLLLKTAKRMRAENLKLNGDAIKETTPCTQP
jgi:hypothetical protein